MMARDSARAFYGPGHVQAAHELGAVQTLLITDTLFRVNNVVQVYAVAMYASLSSLTIPIVSIKVLIL